MAPSFAKGKGCFHQMVTSNLLENFMLSLYCLKIFFTVVFRQPDNFQGIDILSFFSTGHIHLSIGSLT